jgi:hypothetical protein
MHVVDMLHCAQQGQGRLSDGKRAAVPELFQHDRVVFWAPSAKAVAGRVQKRIGCLVIEVGLKLKRVHECACLDLQTIALLELHHASHDCGLRWKCIA